MGRWRPPAPRGSPYITAAGHRALGAELDELWVRRRDVVAALAAAAAEGDRSENAEYIYRKKELAGIDRRIRYLDRRLPELRIVRPGDRGGRIYFGACVDLKMADGSRRRLRLVGPDEADAGAGAISIDAPLAKALLGRETGAVVIVTADGAAARCEVLAVRYDEQES
ncbi:MAG: GreA/GreB family elongation factor [Pseudomonadota bacterium]